MDSLALMAVDKTGKWWVGSEAADIAECLRFYEAGGYAVREWRVTSGWPR